MVRKKTYVKPTIRKHAMFMQRGGFIGLGKGSKNEAGRKN